MPAAARRHERMFSHPHENPTHPPFTAPNTSSKLGSGAMLVGRAVFTGSPFPLAIVSPLCLDASSARAASNCTKFVVAQTLRYTFDILFSCCRTPSSQDAVEPAPPHPFHLLFQLQQHFLPMNLFAVCYLPTQEARAPPMRFSPRIYTVDSPAAKPISKHRHFRVRPGQAYLLAAALFAAHRSLPFANGQHLQLVAHLQRALHQFLAQIL